MRWWFFHLSPLDALLHPAEKLALQQVMKTVTTRPMTKSALAVARQALARDALLPYLAPTSRKTYAQHQLFAALAVRQFLGTDYRGMEQYRKDWSNLRRELGLGQQVPDHTTPKRAADRLLKKGADAVRAGRRSSARRWTRPGAGRTTPAGSWRRPWRTTPSPRPGRPPARPRPSAGRRTGRGRRRAGGARSGTLGSGSAGGSGGSRRRG